ncbi:MAG TPA: alpha/beta hydrolase domain-containing protein, partial [Acidimicrobiia bacterium]|nr:alpha/beta hydrolase domain-containing protein [Acidimicrobiia bacterium]
MRTFRLAIVVFTTVALVGVTGSAAVAASDPTTSPVTGGTGEPSLVTTSFDLASVGYERAEYFLEGDATAYASDVPLTADGKWKVSALDETAPYKTRILV